MRLANVEFCCRTLQEGYERKRAAIQVGNVQDHLELAQWCERHGLLDLAANELSAAAAIEPNHPMVGVLRRRLQLAREPPLQPSESSGGVASPTADELDRMVRGMPPGAVETFAQIVQPLLINHCTSSGCHGPQSETRFRLMRTPVSQPAGRRLTQRNLQAVLEYVDYNAPSSSRLLTVVSGPHGPVRAGTFSDRQAGQYKRIADWVDLVTRQPAARRFRRSASTAAQAGRAGGRGIDRAADVDACGVAGSAVGESEPRGERRRPFGKLLRRVPTIRRRAGRNIRNIPPGPNQRLLPDRASRRNAAALKRRRRPSPTRSIRNSSIARTPRPRPRPPEVQAVPGKNKVRTVAISAAGLALSCGSAALRQFVPFSLRQFASRQNVT